MLTAHISFAADTAREQELLRCEPIGRFALEYAVELIRSAPMLGPGAVLAAHDYPFLDSPDGADLLRLPVGDRDRAERDALRPSEGEGQGASGWQVILRPLKGRISTERLLGFCRGLARLDPAVHSGAWSAVPFTTLTHPLWQCRAVDVARLCGSSIRMDACSGQRESVDGRIYRDTPGLDRAKPAGSQDVAELLHCDGALWAVPAGHAGSEEAVLFASEAEYLADLPPFFQLPVFDMGESVPPDTGAIAGLARIGRHRP
ncbi:hypothetical protein [Pseudodesulfovibrio indicus]|uniref:hypothetical protein n=1 Tax=Pseudodesulfovibrio indicus TaxID=1716143 RepID=UPI00292F6F6F|nr:hypothetical protein [Pseudodesulfovibrio indicus]